MPTYTEMEWERLQRRARRDDVITRGDILDAIDSTIAEVFSTTDAENALKILRRAFE